MKNLKSILLLLSVILVSLSSCKEDEPIDVRDAAIGEYNGTMTFYTLFDDGELIEDEEVFGAPQSISNITISKDNTNEGSIKINLDGDVVYGSKIAEAANGFTFDIESQQFDDMTINGYNTIELGTSKYNGAFDSNTKELCIGFETPISSVFDTESEEYTLLTLGGVESFVFIVECNKR